MTVTESPTSSPSSKEDQSCSPPIERDSSTFSKVLAIYSRNPLTNSLYDISEKNSIVVSKHWNDFVNILETVEPHRGTQSVKVIEYDLPENIADVFTNGMGVPIRVSEFQKDDEVQTRGCVSIIDDNEGIFNDWFIFHILDQSRLKYNEKPIIKTGVAYHELFAEYFAANLKNTTKDDLWELEGRDFFIEKVKYFTDRQLRIECILPAFPCKSSNLDKVNSTLPDKGEELALKRLIKCVCDFQEIYSPGIKFWIVSDGHVFSDCIGVDDDTVNSYTENLHALYKNIIAKSYPNMDTDYIGFCGLNDIFFTGEAADQFNARWVQDTEVLHYTGTKICPQSDLSRQILMKGCDTDDGRLRHDISLPNHPRLFLYRGFSKFMMEDLKSLDCFRDCSKKKFKKTISKIAFNMIRRNDAYSNLVELMFPHHLRISIHAHKNNGPKFGIRVISQDQ